VKRFRGHACTKPRLSYAIGDRSREPNAGGADCTSLQTVEDDQLSISSAGGPAPIEQLAFECCEEALAQRIVVCVVHGAHRRLDAARLLI
jgi:hypothetical protein